MFQPFLIKVSLYYDQTFVITEFDLARHPVYLGHKGIMLALILISTEHAKFGILLLLLLVMICLYGSMISRISCIIS